MVGNWKFVLPVLNIALPNSIWRFGNPYSPYSKERRFDGGNIWKNGRFTKKLLRGTRQNSCWKKDKEIDFDVDYIPESEMEASQAAHNRGEATSQELILETQTQVIPETQDIGNIQNIPETQIDRGNIIVIDDWNILFEVTFIIYEIKIFFQRYYFLDLNLSFCSAWWASLMKSEPLKKIFLLIKGISLFRAPINFRASKCANIGFFRAPFIFAQIKCAKINGTQKLRELRYIYCIKHK